MPVKAGTHTIAATFLKDTVVPEGILFKHALRRRSSPTSKAWAAFRLPAPTMCKGRAIRRAAKRFSSAIRRRPPRNRLARKRSSPTSRTAPIGGRLTADDLPQLLALYKQGAETGGFESGVRLALQKILVSPDFIFRVELDPADAAAGSVRRVSDIELASRLSFFLWSSIPDDELLAVAERGELSDPSVLESQVRRMLADPRSQALVKNFAGQWLFLRNIPRYSRIRRPSRTSDENLRQAHAEGNRAVARKHSCARIAASSIC